ncbi:bifunctional alpha/beta hydrolase/OsmC family protein [Roseivivax sp. GX 12232]|uniref:bifunctional alpha/beta hydrolase/OsmC family protein n=1 Tax=Roseivivax sp. GX 12232 TaxID=2900547 RepID=UPI001E4522C1|nr:bifunctional alpha/beta hydrolase/OsmC family protein [Roseivivax sp. GX 12232]MCE0504329.1 bifunctional alpha/beta hydrolase/OsmC family protein [Roseivivax sp. GX 12232]
MPTEKLTFPGANGDLLAGRLDLPAGPPRAAALFAHCFTCGKDIAAARRIAGQLAAEGFAVLRFDFTGLGHSGGEFENTSFTSNVDDLVAAAEALAARDLAPALLIGHSLGGAAVLKAAGQIPSARAVATIGAPCDPGHVTHNFAAALPQIAREGVAEVSLAGRPFRIGQGFVEDVSEARLAPAIAGLKRALLVLHAPRDATVGIENATAIFSHAKHPKSFVTLDEADHLVSRPEDAEYAASVITAWARRYLDLPAPPARPEAPEGVVRVTENDAAGFLQDVVAGPHHITADEPEAVGGSDQGMTPYNLLCAALGACTAMTLRLYARRKGLPLTHVEVDVCHDKRHAEDAASGGAKVDVFHRVLRLEGDLDEETRARLLEIADKCPVHRTLEPGAKVVTALG